MDSVIRPDPRVLPMAKFKGKLFQRVELLFSQATELIIGVQHPIAGLGDLSGYSAVS